MKSKKKLIILLSVLLVLICLVGGSYGYYVMQLQPVTKETKEISFVVVNGETTDSVLSRLKQEGIIKDVFCTKIYMKLSGQTDIKAGIFVLDANLSTKEIIGYLNDATKAGSEQVMVTIPEGSWAKDIAKIMADNTNVSSEELMNLWNDKEYIKSLADDYFFINEAMFNSEHCYLEGYLFPETYAFLKDTTADAITRRLLDQTEMVLEKYQAEIASSKLTIHEIITLASIVQYEGSKEEDMKLIAGVFYNRLAQGMKLQSSVTVCYALYEFNDWKDCETNNELKSNYNTYYVNGLPPGPILNAGEIAIKAVLEPTDSEYLYFMADVYGDGKVYYAKTYQEHLANVNKYLY